MKLASLTKHLLYQEFVILQNQHKIVCITNKRILVCEMDAITGKLTDNILEIRMDDVKQIALSKGFLKTKVNITFSDDSEIQFKPNNFCVGLSNHKKHLLKLGEMYA